MIYNIFTESKSTNEAGFFSGGNLERLEMLIKLCGHTIIEILKELK